MNKLLILTIGLFLTACGPSKEEIDNHLKVNSKYNIGDIVHIKPDSSKAVIVSSQIDYTGCVCSADLNKSKIKYEIKDHKGNTAIIPQELIYPIVPKSDYE